MPAPDGQIEFCPHQGCNFTCCDFAAGNFIALYPGELEEARSRGRSVDHLHCVADARGGHRAICQAKDKASCDGGYKPLDCASYPFFPTVNDAASQIQAGLKGGKCPLLGQHLAQHRQWVVQRWGGLAKRVPELLDWIRQTSLVGYVPWTRAGQGEEIVQ